MAKRNRFYIGSISTVEPRKCGIANYNADMMEHIVTDKKRVADWGLYSIIKSRLNYEDATRRHVEYNIRQDDDESWKRLPELIIRNVKKREARNGRKSGIYINHEFGIFGPHHTKDRLVYALKRLNEEGVATVTMLHTILRNPNEQKLKTTRGILENTDKAVILSPSGIKTLVRPPYNAPRGKLIHIPHGIPEIYIEETRYELKNRFKLLDKNGNPRKVFTSVGYLSPSKGLEYPLIGLPEVLKKFPEIVYLIAGGTHPEVLRNEGEEYREELMNLTRKLGIRGAVINKNRVIKNLYGNRLKDLTGANVIFWHKHLTQEELLKTMRMSDCGVIGNLGRVQISSGPGSYWIGSSRITIATESPFFKDLEDEGIGLLVGFEQPRDFTDRMLHVLNLNEEDIEELEYAASDVGSKRTWPIVGQMKLNLMEKIIMHKSNLERKRQEGLESKVS